MSAEDLDKFIKEAESDGELQSAIQATMGDKAKICELAVAYEFSVTLEDLDALVSETELNEDDLNNISGGVSRQSGTGLLWTALNARSKAHSP